MSDMRVGDPVLEVKVGWGNLPLVGVFPAFPRDPMLAGKLMAGILLWIQKSLGMDATEILACMLSELREPSFSATDMTKEEKSHLKLVDGGGE